MKLFHQYLVNFVIKIIRFIDPCHSEPSTAIYAVFFYVNQEINDKNIFLVLFL